MHPIPEISKDFRANTSKYDHNIERSIGTFSTKKQFLMEKSERQKQQKMLKHLRLPHIRTLLRMIVVCRAEYWDKIYACLRRLNIRCMHKLCRKRPNTLLVRN